MAIEIYWGSGSPPSWRVLLGLEVKKIPYTSKMIEFSKKEHKTTEFLKMNPRGKVPVVRDGDFVLYESLAILTYLDKKYPKPPLFGVTSEEAGKIMMAVSEITSYLEPKLSKVTRPIYFNEVDQKRESILEAMPEVQKEFTLFDERLAKVPWLTGETLSVADLFLFPDLQTMIRAAGKENAKSIDHGFEHWEKRFPGLFRWKKRMEAIPGYENTYPPHWKNA